MKPSEAADMAIALMKAHGLDDYKFRFNQRRTSLGRCNSWLRVIELSMPFVRLNDQTAVLDTILHEIAHALVGSHMHHSEEWKAKAKEIGCTGTRCADPNLYTKIPPRFELVCKNCGLVVGFHRKPKKRYACACCSPTFNEAFLMQIRDRQSGKIVA